MTFSREISESGEFSARLRLTGGLPDVGNSDDVPQEPDSASMVRLTRRARRGNTFKTGLEAAFKVPSLPYQSGAHATIDPMD